MIKNIIFDFGDIFINLDKEIITRAFKQYGNTTRPSEALLELNNNYEIGAISSTSFIESLSIIYPKASSKTILEIWNGILLDFPEERLNFIEQLAKENSYRLFLLSNTNELHIENIISKMGEIKYKRFKNCFEKFYLSHEIQLRKPNNEIYNFVLEENGLNAEETFFIDDTKENTDAAKKLGINCWNLQVGNEDIIHLKTKITE